MARLIDDEAEGADLVLPGRDKETALLGIRIAPPALRGDYLGEAAMLVGSDRRDCDPIARMVVGKGFAIARAGFTGLERPAMDRLPGIRPAVAQGLFSLTALEPSEEIGPGCRDSGPGGILLIPTSSLAQQGMDTGIAVRRKVEPAMASAICVRSNPKRVPMS